jgi:CBS domain-containing protein
MPVPSTHPPLSSILARDAMHTPVVTCDADAPLSEVARLMGHHRIHAVVVHGLTARGAGGRGDVLGVVDDLDLVRAAVADDGTATARAMAGTEPLTVGADDDLVAVATALAAHDCAHALVVDGERPVGVISTLDLASALAG